MSAATEQQSAGQDNTAAIAAPASQVTSDPIRDQNTSDLSPESRPELGMNGVPAGDPAATPTGPNVTNVTKEVKVENGEVMVESHTINEGVLNYKGPGLKGLIFSKKYFWLSDAPVEHGQLSGYLSNEKSKDIAHPNAAHATQTGKGLLFYAKRSEDKGHPQGIFNLADVTDVVKGNFNDFGFTLNGHKHNFQATTKSDKDAWLVTIETKAAEAKTAREGIVGSSGYKSQLEKYGVGTAAATSAPRSRSRGMMAGKSRESKTKDTPTHTTPEAAAAAFNTTSETATGATTTSDAPTTAADMTTGTTPDTTTDAATGATTGEHAGEVAAGGAVVGAVGGAAAARDGSTSEEEKSKAAKKSRSRSRNNKRSSIFGGLLGRKEDKQLDKEEKKEDKAETKELKKEEKAEKKEDKAIGKENKVVAKDIKHEDKAEKKAEKQESTEEAKEDVLLGKEAKQQDVANTGEFDAVAVANRVVGEPIVPADETTAGAGGSGVAPVAGAEPTVAETTPASTTRETALKPNKRNSIFGSIFGKKDTATPTSTETPPAVPAKDEVSALSSTAPQLDNPVTSSTAETTESTTEDPAPAPAAEATAPAAATSPVSPTDKRRSSFFGNLGTKKERRTGGTSDNELTDGEGKKQSSGGFGGLLRKASRAQKGSSSAATKDSANVPLPTETPAEAITNDGTLAEKPAATEGETGIPEQTAVSAAA